jgi:homoserine kinase
MRARTPASSANLGPGFDAVALALACYVEVSVEPASSLKVSARGHGAELPGGARHLAVRAASEVAGHDRLAIEVDSGIPVGRGLGSSAAVAVAAAAAAGASADEALSVAARLDGHPDNAAASALGGLVAVSIVGGSPLARRLPLDPALRFVLVIPDRELPTEQARALLPTTISRADAAFNLGRLALLLAGLADRKQLVAAAGDDRLHQDARSELFPEAPALLRGLRDAGAFTSCWSGAGPSLLAITDEDHKGELEAAAGELLARHSLGGEVRVLEADTAGVRISG